MNKEGAYKPLNVDIDGILEEIGGFGKYQLKTFLWLIFPVILASMQATNYVFSATDTNYRCKIDGCDIAENEFNPQWLDYAIPIGDRCTMYARLNSSGNSSCLIESFDKNDKISCSAYIFEAKDTFIEEMNIPCEDWKRTLVGTMHSVGMLISMMVIGHISDRFGRCKTLITTCMLGGIVGIIKSQSINYAMFLSLELIEPILGAGLYTSCYVLGVEMLPPSTRVFGSASVNSLFGVGQVVLGLIAWALPYWRTYLLVIYSPALLGFVYYWLLEESSRWLLSKKRYQDVIDNLEVIAKENKKELSHKLINDLTFNAEQAFKLEQFEEKSDEAKTNGSTIKKFLKSKILTIRLLKCSFWWMTCLFSFYGLSINAVFLSGNSYVNFMLSGFMDVPANIIAYFTLKHFGRKNTIFTSFLLGGISCISISFVPEDLNWLALVLYLLGKLFVGMSLSSIYLYTSELFPTAMRHSLLAFCSMMGKIGSVSAPQTPLLSIYMQQMPSILFGSTCIISALLMLTSPETLNLRLPDTIEEAENISELKIK